MVQTVELTCVQHGEAIPLGLRNTAAGKYDSIVGISACDESAGGIDARTIGGIVELRKKLSKAAPTAMPRGPDRMPDPIFERELPSRLPAVLRKPVNCSRDPRRHRLAAQFRVIIEQAEQSVPDGEIRGICTSGIEKPERSVFIDCRRRTRGRA